MKIELDKISAWYGIQKSEDSVFCVILGKTEDSVAGSLYLKKYNLTIIGGVEFAKKLTPIMEEVITQRERGIRLINLGLQIFAKEAGKDPGLIDDLASEIAEVSFDNGYQSAKKQLRHWLSND